MLIRKKPVLCNYYLTYRCNASCSFCDIWEKPSPYVTEQNFSANLKDLKKLGVKIIDFTGGEPLLHQGLGRFLELAKEMGFVTTVTTNCLLYPKRALELKGKVDMLHFSLDSADKEKHNKSRNVDCFDHFEASLQIAKDLGERPDILFTVHEDNYLEIVDVYNRYCEPNNIVLIINPIFDYASVSTNQLSEDALSFLRNFSKKKWVYLNEAFISLRLDGGNKVSDPVCKAGTTTVVISPENKLMTPCYHLNTKSFQINDDLYDLHNNANVKEALSKEGVLHECEGCTINCYMQPSFAVNVNKYFWKALPSTLKYNKLKQTYRQYLFGAKKKSN